MGGYIKSPREKYYNDPKYHAFVDMLCAAIHSCHYTPSELREMVLLACILYEEQSVKRMCVSRYPEDVVNSLNIIYDWTGGL